MKKFFIKILHFIKAIISIFFSKDVSTGNYSIRNRAFFMVLVIGIIILTTVFTIRIMKLSVLEIEPAIFSELTTFVTTVVTLLVGTMAASMISAIIGTKLKKNKEKEEEEEEEEDQASI